jgi:hypothetical protein
MEQSPPWEALTVTQLVTKYFSFYGKPQVHSHWSPYLPFPCFPKISSNITNNVKFQSNNYILLVMWHCSIALVSFPLKHLDSSFFLRREWNEVIVGMSFRCSFLSICFISGTTERILIKFGIGVCINNIKKFNFDSYLSNIIWRRNWLYRFSQKWSVT